MFGAYALSPGKVLILTWKIMLLPFRQFNLSYSLLCYMCIYIVCVRAFVLASGAGSSPDIIMLFIRRRGFV